MLPTTPFLLLSAYLFVRSSNRLYQWLINHRVFGRYIHDYLEKRSIPRRVKWYTLALLWTSILWCIASLELSNPFRVVLLAIAVGVTIHIVNLRNSD
ncbi:YbaN family protein [Tenuifilum sp.]|uniref:YbaN family protein n=1 Tax=Tenuifilum sp. TaxID=2760880 RepID=UPI0025873811|nr:YbaN family protein [Tenuifilum sp.]